MMLALFLICLISPTVESHVRSSATWRIFTSLTQPNSQPGRQFMDSAHCLLPSCIAEDGPASFPDNHGSHSLSVLVKGLPYSLMQSPPYAEASFEV
ncbi:hypothetical protein F5Y10DRAFT_247074 [Nemania abortiva]|nr:hypothetical protein F5Y10DRAFT_247074 [Nemania abortiva]